MGIAIEFTEEMGFDQDPEEWGNLRGTVSITHFTDRSERNGADGLIRVCGDDVEGVNE